MHIKGNKPFDGVFQLLTCTILGDPGADSGGKGKSKRAEKYGTKKSKERREEPVGTMSYQTSPKQSPPFCLFRLSLAPTICPWVSEDGHVPVRKLIETTEQSTLYSSAKLSKCTDVCMVGRKFVPPTTNYTVFKISRVWDALSALVFNKSLSNFATFINLRAVFPEESTDVFSLTCPWTPLNKVETTMERSITRQAIAARP